MLRSDTLIPLEGGAYSSRSKISNYQIQINLFNEINPPTTDSPTPDTLYPREGLRPLSAPPAPGFGRGVFTMSNGALFATVGTKLYYVDPNWVWTLLGTLSTNVTTPVSMADNGIYAVLVDGSPNGYTVALAGNVFAQLFDPTGQFVGSIRTDFADTFLAFSAPGTNEWYVSLSNQINFNALVNANKDSKPDPIVTLAFNIRQAWLLGASSSEVWYLAGSTPFPYQEWPNIFIPYGCAALYSLVQADVDLFWLSRNDQGQTIAVKSKGYAVIAFSTRALEYEWSQYGNVDDAIGMTFQQAGHTFVIFHFPSADRSWGYDLSTQQWHRRTYTDRNGVAHREKVSFCASVGQQGGYPTTIVGQDWATGQIYAMDPKTYTDNGMPIVMRRTFPHVMKDMKEITHVSFVADFETGGIVGFGENNPFPGNPWSDAFNNAFGPLAGTYNPNSGPALFMRYSNDGGNTWSRYRQKGLVTSGNYRSMMRYRGLGMARDRVYEVIWAYPGPSALQGAYLDPILHSA
jgi:hypothetical protein